MRRGSPSCCAPTRDFGNGAIF